MSKKILVLCSEKPTVNINGKRIEEDGRYLTRTENGWADSYGEEVKVAESKKIINANEMLFPITPESIMQSKIIFTNWEGVVPSDTGLLQTLIEYGKSKKPIPKELLLKCSFFKNIMTKAFFDRLIMLDSEGERPAADYKSQAMDNFMELILRILDSHEITTVIPAFSVNDSTDVVNIRKKVIQRLKQENSNRESMGIEKVFDILDSVLYESFDTLYEVAYKKLKGIKSTPHVSETNNKFDDGSR